MARPKKKRPIPVEVIGPDKDDRYCAFVTVGTKPNGQPDRRKRSGKTPEIVKDRIREPLAEVERRGCAPRAGPKPTVASWLEHWLTNVVSDLRYNTVNRYYGWAVRQHLVPGLGAYRLDALQPEHLEQLYARLRDHGLAESSVKHVHVTIRAALTEALRKGHVTRNVAAREWCRAPQVDLEEVEPFDDAEVAATLDACERRRNGARWALGLSLGLRQGEILALRWDVDVDLDRGYLWVRRKAQRRAWQHGCDDPAACARRKCRTTPCRGPWRHGCDDPAACVAGKHRGPCAGVGRMHDRHARTGCPAPCPAGCVGHARTCPQRTPGPCTTHLRDKCPPLCPRNCTGHARACPLRRDGGIVYDEPKSRAGRRKVGIPAQLVERLREHRRQQREELIAAGVPRERREAGLVFANPRGGPIDARADWDDWKDLLRESKVRDARVHDGRHTAATMLLAEGVDPRLVMDIMGWSNEGQRRRYQHVVDELRDEAARRIGDRYWGGSATGRATGNRPAR